MSRPSRDFGTPFEHVAVNRDGCWEWQEYRNGTTGYGMWGSQYAHRLYYELWHDEIPRGLTIDHLCRNRCCVNPEHLEAVTLRQNILRSDNLAARNARKTHCVRGHEFTPENTMQIPNGRGCRECNRDTQRSLYAKKKATGRYSPSKTPEARHARYVARKATQ